MRASMNCFWVFMVAGCCALIGCGDSLDVGGSGTGQPIGNPEPCPTPGGPGAACEITGETCTGPDQTACCCTPSTDLAEPVLQCFANAACCPADTPQVGAPCDCANASTCTYCSANGPTRFICGPNGTWMANG